LKKFLSLIVILFILFPMFTSVAEASTFPEVKKVQTATQLRATASPKANIVSSLPKGALVTQLNTVKGGWSYVRVNDKKGYVATSSLIVPSSKTKIVSSKSGLVIKETASAKAKTAATLKQNMVVEDFGTVGNGWTFVQSGNVIGYVASNLITASKPSKKYTNADVTVRNIASTSGKNAGSLTKNKEVYVHSQIANWSYITSGSLKGYIPTSRLSATKQSVAAQTLKTFTDLRPSKIKWMKYYFDGKVLQGNIQSNVYKNEYEYVVPSIYMAFSPNGFQMGMPESDFIWTDIPTTLVQDKATPVYEFDWYSYKDVHIGNAYLRKTNGTITTPAGTFKNVVHIEEKYYNLSYTIHYYFAPGYGLVKVNDSKNRLSYELRSYK
jgi:uncharacterized protein YgiM (DUF1202 family)